MTFSVRRRLRKWLGAEQASPRPMVAAVENKKHARDVGLRDAVLSGWFCQETSELVTGFPIPAGETTIDLGCGHGGATAFALRCGANVIACDIDPKKIEQVNASLKPIHGDALRTIVSDSNPLPLPDGIASRVIAMEVMEHVDDPAGFLSELVRVGTHGALYLIAVPDAGSEAIQKPIASPSYWEKPNHIHVFCREELDRLIEAAGLKIERRLHCGFFWTIWWTLFWESERKIDDEYQGPILDNWTKTWDALIASPRGMPIKAALDEFLPKSQIVIARKA
jgi:SAM-dependent methyltransferase